MWINWEFSSPNFFLITSVKIFQSSLYLSAFQLEGRVRGRDYEILVFTLDKDNSCTDRHHK